MDIDRIAKSRDCGIVVVTSEHGDRLSETFREIATCSRGDRPRVIYALTDSTSASRYGKNSDVLYITRDFDDFDTALSRIPRLHPDLVPSMGCNRIGKLRRLWMRRFAVSA